MNMRKIVLSAISFAMLVFCLVMTAFAEAPVSIKELNTVATEASHVGDDYGRASMEINYRESYELRSSNTGYTRYDHAWYPRIKKVNESLYLMLYMYDELGPHLYWNTSTDGITWGNPQVFYNNNEKNFVYEGGEFDGVADRFCAVNADACVLDNGEILCVYFVRPNKGYRVYPDLSGMFMVRGTVSGNTIVWGEHEKIYTGQGWEPYIWQRDDGQVEIYWSGAAPYMVKYGYDEVIRSAGVLMIKSNDNGETWSPDVQAGDTNYYQAIRVFSQYLGDRVHTAQPDLGALPYFGGQMPVVTKLYNGKTLLAAEVRTLGLNFTVATTVSEANGEWKNLGMTEATENSNWEENFSGAAPYLARFPSGEVYLTYTNGTDLWYKIGSPEGTAFNKKGFNAAPGSYGCWGSCEMVGSHEMITVAQRRTTTESGLMVFHSYLNHRTDANKINVNVDGSMAEWANNTDAVFVGSKTQAQITLRTAHDDDNVYFLISRLDEYLAENDSVLINIGTGKYSMYRVTVGNNGIESVTYVENGVSKEIEVKGNAVTKLYGTLGNNSDKDVGSVTEISIPKTLVGLSGATSFTVAPMLVNQDGVGSVSDTLDGIAAYCTDAWPMVELK